MDPSALHPIIDLHSVAQIEGAVLSKKIRLPVWRVTLYSRMRDEGVNPNRKTRERLLDQLDITIPTHLEWNAECSGDFAAS